MPLVLIFFPGGETHSPEVPVLARPALLLAPRWFYSCDVWRLAPAFLLSDAKSTRSSLPLSRAPSSCCLALTADGVSVKSACAKPRGQPVVRSTATRTSARLGKPSNRRFSSASVLSYGMLPMKKRRSRGIGLSRLPLLGLPGARRALDAAAMPERTVNVGSGSVHVFCIVEVDEAETDKRTWPVSKRNAVSTRRGIEKNGERCQNQERKEVCNGRRDVCYPSAQAPAVAANGSVRNLAVLAEDIL